ncbi:MAG: hypothetical protein HY253_13040 [Burkholderiales bacterium]|nr:hypothetical protein [Burkholderiales bacterium]
MPKWLEQAIKNDVEILEDGQCQLCGSDTLHGISECVATAAKLGHRLSHEKGVQQQTIFLCVDAHALQHPQIHGRWNNHFHLARLHLIVHEKIQWTYDDSEILNAVLDAYKVKHAQEFIPPPDLAGKYCLTVIDVDASRTEEEFIAMVWQWAEQVYAAHAASHDVAHRLAKQFHQHKPLRRASER